MLWIFMLGHDHNDLVAICRIKQQMKKNAPMPMWSGDLYSKNTLNWCTLHNGIQSLLMVYHILCPMWWSFGFVQILFHWNIETHELLANLKFIQKLFIKSRMLFPSTFIAKISMLCFGVTYKILWAKWWRSSTSNVVGMSTKCHTTFQTEESSLTHIPPLHNSRSPKASGLNMDTFSSSLTSP